MKPPAQPRADAPGVPSLSPWIIAVPALGAAILVVALLGIRRVWDVDYWWQVATGRWMIEHHAIMRADVFTWTRPGTARIESSWLYCVVLEGLVRAGGVALAVCVKAALMLGAFGSVAWAGLVRTDGRGGVWGVGGWIAVSCAAMVAALASSQRFVLRPEVVTYAMLGVFVLVVSRWGMRRGVWVLPALMIVWTNCHSGFGLGLLVVGAWWCEAVAAAWTGRGGAERWNESRRSAGVLVLCAGATLVTPYGLGLHRVAFDHLGTMVGGLEGSGVWARVLVLVGCVLVGVGAWFARGRAEGATRLGRAFVCGVTFVVGALTLLWVVRPDLIPEMGEWVELGETSSIEKAVISELASPLVLDPGFTAIGYFRLLIGMVCGSVLVSGGRVRLMWLVLVGAGLVLAMTAVRNVPILALVSVPVIVGPGAAGVSRRLGPTALAWGQTALAAAVVGLGVHQARALVTDRFHIVQGDSNQFGLGIAANQFALTSVEFAARHLREPGGVGWTTRVFNASAAGGVLIHAGVPVFIDPRFLSGSLEEYLRYMESPEVFSARLDEAGVGACVLTPVQSALAAHIAGMAGWRLVFADATGVVLFRDGVGSGAARLDVATDGGVAWLAGLRAGLPSPHSPRSAGVLGRVANPSAYLAAARLAAALGAHEAAQRLYLDAHDAYPPVFRADGELMNAMDQSGDFGAAARLGFESEARGDDGSALEWSIRAMKHSPGDPGVRALYERVRARVPVEERVPDADPSQ